jgi:hypothetical protein
MLKTCGAAGFFDSTTAGVTYHPLVLRQSPNRRGLPTRGRAGVRAIRTTIGLCLVLFAGGAHGQVAPSLIFQDDVEAGATLLTPTGMWDTLITNSSSAIAGSTSASHRGSWGIQAVDGNGAAGNVFDEADVKSALSVTSGSVYARFWMRPGTISNLTSAADSMDFAQLNTGTFTLGHVELLIDGVVQLGGYLPASQGGYSNIGTSVSLVEGTWYLFELSADGIGTAAGVRTLWVNGQLAATQTGLDFTGLSFSYFILGFDHEVDGPVMGELDFDDVRVSIVPPASTLIVTAPPGPLQLGTCTPITVGLVDSVTGVPAMAPYAVTASVLDTGTGGAFFGDSSCSVGTAVVTISAGSSSASLWFKTASVGIASISATQVDFLSTSSATFTVLAEAGGADAGPTALGHESFGIGCSCNSSGEGSVLPALVLIFALLCRGGRADVRP